MKTLKPQDVDVYIAKASSEAQPILQELRELIKRVIPNVEEGTWHGMPFYKHRGEPVGFAAYKRHASIGFGINVFKSKDRNALEQEGYKTGEGTIQIKYDQKVPIDAIERILKGSL